MASCRRRNARSAPPRLEAPTSRRSRYAQRVSAHAVGSFPSRKHGGADQVSGSRRQSLAEAPESQYSGKCATPHINHRAREAFETRNGYKRNTTIRLNRLSRPWQELLNPL